jgi:hypothetical protein
MSALISASPRIVTFEGISAIKGMVKELAKPECNFESIDKKIQSIITNARYSPNVRGYLNDFWVANKIIAQEEVGKAGQISKDSFTLFSKALVIISIRKDVEAYDKAVRSLGSDVEANSKTISRLIKLNFRIGTHKQYPLKIKMFFTNVWSNYGSKAHDDVRTMKPINPRTIGALIKKVEFAKSKLFHPLPWEVRVPFVEPFFSKPQEAISTSSESDLKATESDIKAAKSKPRASSFKKANAMPSGLKSKVTFAISDDAEPKSEPKKTRNSHRGTRGGRKRVKFKQTQLLLKSGEKVQVSIPVPKLKNDRM